MNPALELPDALLHEVKRRAADEGREVNDVVADLLMTSLAPKVAPGPEDSRLVSKTLPLIKVRPAQPLNAQKLTTQEWCDWLKDLDLQLEVERHEKALGHQHVDRADS